MKNRIEFKKLFSIILFLISVIAPFADSIACDTCYENYGHRQSVLNQVKANINQSNLSVVDNSLPETFNDDMDQCICPLCSSAAEDGYKRGKALLEELFD